jgi:hypothetical protein
LRFANDGRSGRARTLKDKHFTSCLSDLASALQQSFVARKRHKQKRIKLQCILKNLGFASWLDDGVIMERQSEMIGTLSYPAETSSRRIPAEILVALKRSSSESPAGVDSLARARRPRRRSRKRPRIPGVKGPANVSAPLLLVECCHTRKRAVDFHAFLNTPRGLWLRGISGRNMRPGTDFLHFSNRVECAPCEIDSERCSCVSRLK